ncbi:MAG: acyl-CoA thioesterase [Myxococcota bacterium]
MHRSKIRIYLEDTDAQGVVYHANYLKYCERSRTDILMDQGFTLAELQAQGWTLVVHEMNIKFKRPARLHDDILVLTTARKSSEFRVTFHHDVFRDGEDKPLFIADVQVVAIGADGALVGMPEGLLSTPVA